MADESSIVAALTRHANLSFPSNLALLNNFSAGGGRVSRQPSGHLVVYGPHNRRILSTDPEGNPLHECEWITASDGRIRLARARFRLDWGQWVGLKPAGLENSTVLDLSRRPGWERIRADDLRQIAAQAMRVPIEEMRFFYGDEDLVIDDRGQATIRHRKDALYALDEGTFDAAPDRIRFMACLGAMHWDRIDFLPVVELFQSLLSGTGSAAFEFIRGLYDDQNEQQSLPLRYRGIPAYPSEAAFRLFSGFFDPHAPGGRNPYPLFLDPAHSHEVTWLPTPEPPRRYFDTDRQLCITIKGNTVQKVTLADDSTGLSFINAEARRFAPCERSIEVSGGTVILKDGARQSSFPADPAWGPLHDIAPHTSGMSSLLISSTMSPQAINWRDLFGGHPPEVSPSEAFSAVLLYPDDDTEIGEAPTHPFVADYLQDLADESPELSASPAEAGHVLIDNFDGAVMSYFRLADPRGYTILYHHPALAQRQAQAVWNYAAQENPLDLAAKVKFLPAAREKEAYEQHYDVIYRFIRFSQFDHPFRLTEAVTAVTQALNSGGLAFVVGPPSLPMPLQGYRFRIVQVDLVENLPTFRMHRTILPKARLNPGLTLYQIIKD